MPHRSRRYYNAAAVAGQGESIALNEEMPFHATLLQITVKLGAVQTSTDIFTVLKDSTIGAIYDVELYAEDFAIKELTDIIIPCKYELQRFDRLVITYANTDDVNVGVEAVIEEAH